ncbi:MAG: histidine phosphatase family protein [Chloroflexi bacterium]|nr:histidine phosphatase family protein [Chloroflexota bacterium]
MAHVQGISWRQWRKGSILVLLAALLLSLLALQSLALTGAEADGGAKTTVYFLRHAEDSIELVQTGGSGTASDPFTYVQNFIGSCAVRPLNVLGEERAFLLGEYFETKNIPATLTHVLATHKVRTQQTVQHIADKAGLDLTQVPAGDECPLGLGFSVVGQPTIDFILDLPLGNVVAAANHSNNLYPMMRALGIDTSDPVTFPKDSRGNVAGHNNLWIVKIDASGVGELDKHIVLDLIVDETN